MGVVLNLSVCGDLLHRQKTNIPCKFLESGLMWSPSSLYLQLQGTLMRSCSHDCSVIWQKEDDPGGPNQVTLALQKQREFSGLGREKGSGFGSMAKTGGVIAGLKMECSHVRRNVGSDKEFREAPADNKQGDEGLSTTTIRS